MSLRRWTLVSLLVLLVASVLYQSIPRTGAAAADPRVAAMRAIRAQTPIEVAWRELAVTRSNRSLVRPGVPAAKPVTRAKTVSTPRSVHTAVHTPVHYPPALPVGVYQAYAAARVAGATQFGCLQSLWNRESHWNPHADNKHSTAYGIAQLLGETSRDGYVQILHGLAYIVGRYGSPGGPCRAWAHSLATGWY